MCAPQNEAIYVLTAQPKRFLLQYEPVHKSRVLIKTCIRRDTVRCAPYRQTEGVPGEAKDTIILGAAPSKRHLKSKTVHLGLKGTISGLRGWGATTGAVEGCHVMCHVSKDGNAATGGRRAIHPLARRRPCQANSGRSSAMADRHKKAARRAARASPQTSGAPRRQRSLFCCRSGGRSVPRSIRRAGTAAGTAATGCDAGCLASSAPYTGSGGEDQPRHPTSQPPLQPPPRPLPMPGRCAPSAATALSSARSSRTAPTSGVCRQRRKASLPTWPQGTPRPRATAAAKGKAICLAAPEPRSLGASEPRSLGASPSLSVCSNHRTVRAFRYAGH